MVQPLWRTVWRILKKLKVDLPHDPAVACLGIYPEKTKNLETINAREGVEKREPSCTVGGNVN